MLSYFSHMGLFLFLTLLSVFSVVVYLYIFFCLQSCSSPIAAHTWKIDLFVCLSRFVMCVSPRGALTMPWKNKNKEFSPQLWRSLCFSAIFPLRQLNAYVCEHCNRLRWHFASCLYILVQKIFQIECNNFINRKNSLESEPTQGHGGVCVFDCNRPWVCVPSELRLYYIYLVGAQMH